MYYLKRKVCGDMKKHRANDLFNKDALIAMLITMIFIFSYIMVVFYTYNRVETMAQDTLLQSTVSSATSFHKIIENEQTGIRRKVSSVKVHFKTAIAFKRDGV